MGEAIVSLQALDGLWEVAGRDRYPGVVPESVSVQSDPGGFAVCSFQMRRPDLWLPSADLSARTPCEIDEGEARIFEGWVHETPISAGEGVVNVAGRGFQYALDDDSVQPLHLGTDLSIFADTRSLYGYANGYSQLGRVEASQAGVTFGWANGAVVPLNDYVGVTADFGEPYDLEAIPLVLGIQYDTLGALVDFTLLARATDTMGTGGALPTGDDYFSIAMNARGAASQVRVHQVATPRRYLHLVLQATNAKTMTADCMVRVKRIWLSRGRTAFGSQGGSYLRSSDTIRHAVGSAAPGLKLAAQDAPNLWTEEIVAMRIGRWWRPGLSGSETRDFSGSVDKDGDPSVLAQTGVPVYSATGGPVDDGTPTGYVTLGGSPAALSIAASDLVGLALTRDFTLGIVYRTTNTNGVSPGNFRQGAGLISGVVGVGNADLGLTMVGGVLHAGIGNPDTSIRDTIVTNDGNWHMAVFTRNAARARLELYRDGLLVGSSAAAHVNDLTALPTIIGATPGAGFHVGDIAEILIAAEALPPVTITHLWRALRNRPRTKFRSTLLRLDSFPPSAPRTAREITDAANAFHGYRARVIRDREFAFESQPSLAKYAIGPWAAERFDDASANSAEEVWNAVQGSANDFDGHQVQVRRFAGDLPEAPRLKVSSPSLPAGSSAGTALHIAITGLLERGRTYWIRGTYQHITGNPAKAGDYSKIEVFVLDTADATNAVRRTIYTKAGQTVAFEIPFASKRDITTAELAVLSPAWITSNAVANMSIARGLGGILDRRNVLRVHRLELGFQATAQTLAAFSDAFLRAHRLIPMRGGVPIEPGDLLNITTGETVHPRNLVCEEGELIHFHNFIDPDTGATGRDGAIAAVTYDPPSERAQVSIDNQRDNFEKLLGRYAIVQGTAQ